MHVRLDFPFSFRSVLIVLIFCLPFKIPQMESHAYTYSFISSSNFFNLFFRPAETDSHFPRTACKYSCKIAIGISGYCVWFFSVCLHTAFEKCWTCSCAGAKSHQLSSLYTGILISLPSHKCAFLLCLPFENKRNVVLLLTFSENVNVHVKRGPNKTHRGGSLCFSCCHATGRGIFGSLSLVYFWCSSKFITIFLPSFGEIASEQ